MHWMPQECNGSNYKVIQKCNMLSWIQNMPIKLLQLLSLSELFTAFSMNSIVSNKAFHFVIRHKQCLF